MIQFASDPTLEVFPGAQSECAQILIPGERYRRTVATRDYKAGPAGEWRRYATTREPVAPLTTDELAALRSAPRSYLCG